VISLHVFTRSNEANVHDVLRLLAYEFPTMNRALWTAVNKAPELKATERVFSFIGSMCLMRISGDRNLSCGER
jgi:hypothetical protein